MKCSKTSEKETICNTDMLAQIY